MPYYCTVPRCTSMAGKAKNVSFHQFPRDEELAKLWNEILKRGKPYTKYSKVCSLHFKPEDYTITGLGRNKGLWRTLRKDAVPSQNLPTDSPIPCQKTKNAGPWSINNSPSNIMDTQLHQVAQAIYTQTVLAIQASGARDLSRTSIYNEQERSPIREDSASQSSNSSGQFNETMSQIEQLLHKNNINTELNTDSVSKFNNNDNVNMFSNDNSIKRKSQIVGLKHTYKCMECSKCFKDPDVFILHKRIHTPKNLSVNVFQKSISENVCSEKENFNSNASSNCMGENSTEETLRANPILANLLKSSMPQTLHKGEEMQQILDYKNVMSIENQIMSALASNMKSYFRNLSMITQRAIIENENNSEGNNDNFVENNDSVEVIMNTRELNEDVLKDEAHGLKRHMSLDNEVLNCDSKDLNESMNSSSFIIDEDSQNCDFTVRT